MMAREATRVPSGPPHKQGARGLVTSLMAIVFCGGIGAVMAWWIVRAIGVDGVAGALVTVFVAMALALALFALVAWIAKVWASRRR